LPAELVEFRAALARRFAGTEPYFQPPVEPPADATAQERLIALTGRRPAGDDELAHRILACVEAIPPGHS